MIFIGLKLKMIHRAIALCIYSIFFLIKYKHILFIQNNKKEENNMNNIPTNNKQYE